jgi:hypothetical protein
MSARSLILRVVPSLCAMVGGLMFSGAAAQAEITYPYTGSFGPQGVSIGVPLGEFEDTQSIAVDQGTGDVYVYDIESNGGSIYKFNAAGEPAEFSGLGSNAIEGVGEEASSGEAQIAVDNSTGPDSGDIYAANGETLRIYNSAGELKGELEESEAEADHVPWGYACGVAVDPEGNVYVALRSSGVNKYKSAKAGTITDADYVSSLLSNGDIEGTANRIRNTCDIGVGADDDVYGAFDRQPAMVSRYVPSQFNLTGSPPALGVEIDERGGNLAVDPSSSDVFVDQHDRGIAEYGPAGELFRTFAETGSEAISESISSGIAVDHASGQVYVSYHGVVEIFTPVAVPERPMIERETASGVAADSAKLQASINPSGSETTTYFLYGQSSCAASPSSCADAPSPPGTSIGSGESGQQLSTQIQGLTPDTIYHYRAVAINANGIAYGDEREFTTQPGGGEEFVLPDDRQWELVSSPDKDGATIYSLSRKGSEGVVEAAQDGGAITYLANAPIGEATRNVAPDVEQILSTRGAGSWSSQSVSPPTSSPTGILGGSEEPEGGEYKWFSNDLSVGLLEQQGTAPLSSGASEGTLYLRDDTSGAELPLLTAANTPVGTELVEKGHGGTEESNVHFVDATPDLTHVIFESPALLTPNAVTITRYGNVAPNLYEWAGGQLQLVTVLPNGKPDSEGGVLGVGSGQDIVGNELVSSELQNAISSDGERVFWTGGGGGITSHLFLRDMVQSETVQVDAAQGISEPTGEAEADFQSANSDGSRVFFTDGEKLTSDSTASGPEAKDLYEFEVTSGAGQPLAGKLTDLTVQKEPTTHGSAAVQQPVLGGSEDDSYVYFVARGVLASGASESKETNVEVRNENIYVSHNVGAEWTTSFVSTIFRPGGRSEEGVDFHSRVSSNGRYLAFEGPKGVSLYDSDTGQVVCVSCSATGEEDGAAGSLPGLKLSGFSRAVYQPRYLSNSGRLFFETTAALVSQDTNGQKDVYEYEPAGIGSCTSASTTFSAVTGGCVGLISSGTASEESSFLDASENGDEVFFLTNERLVPQDYDSAPDVYDARVCSASSPCFTAAAVSPICTTADACRAASSPQPTIFGAPPSSTFSGPGNIAPAVATSVARSKPLTRAQKLAKALKVCKKNKPKHKRAVCEARARKRYAKKSKAKKSKAKKSVAEQGLSGMARR